MNNRKRKEFIGLPAPVNYIPGMGRGATAFTTRSDIGPARDDTDLPDERHTQFKKFKDDDNDDNLNETNFDEFVGYGESLCAKDPYDEEDQEADKIYQMIDEHMDERRKSYRKKREEEDKKRIRKTCPTIEEEFADLKRELKKVTYEEWKSIPEVGNSKNKKQRNPRHEMVLPTPDNLIQQQYNSFQTQNVDGSITPGIFSTMPDTNRKEIDMVKIGRARTMLMDSKLNAISDSITGQTNIDSKGYLTDLQSMTPQIGGNYGNDVSDAKQVRKLLKNLVKADPTNHLAWVGYARFEEHFNKTAEAKMIVMDACKSCPGNEELWLEAVRIVGTHSNKDNTKNAKAVVDMALKEIPDSVNLWMKSAELEEYERDKKTKLKEALKHVPDSVQLWKSLIEMEEKDEAKDMLKIAVDCCPTSVEMWLALARLCNPEEARHVLNKARENVPSDRKVWIAALKLEEDFGDEDKIPFIVKRAIHMLSLKVAINRDEWMQEAQQVEESGYPISARKIVEQIAGLNVEMQDRKSTWMADTEVCEKIGCIECARAIYEVAVTQLSMKKSVWCKAAHFERKNGTRESYEAILRRAVDVCSKTEVLWLMLAKSRWEAGEIDEARTVLNSAFTANPNSEEIMLAAIKLESETNQYARARKLYDKALKQVSTPRVWMKSARLEWCLGDLERAHQLLVDSTAKYPIEEPKLWMMLGQVREQISQTKESNEQKKSWIDQALVGLREGLNKNPGSVDLCLVLADMEERYAALINDGVEEPIRARATLDKCGVKYENNAQIWLAKIKLEIRAGKLQQAEFLMSCALQKCPRSDILWSEKVQMTPLKRRITVAKEAVSICENSEHVLLSAAKVFWANQMHKKAREWIEKAIKVEPLFGDGWAYLYRLLVVMSATEDDRNDVIKRCVEVEPRYGQYWTSITKHVDNWKIKTQQILLKVAAIVPIPV